MSRDSQRGTFLSRAVLASTGNSEMEGDKNDYEILLAAFGITSDGIRNKNNIISDMI